LAGEVYKVTQHFPVEERYGLVSQLRRSVTSVSANIAEGTTRQTAKDQAHFTTISYSSLMEVFNHLIISADLGLINDEKLNTFRQSIQTLSVKLTNLKATQVKRIGKLMLIWLAIIAPKIIKPLVPLSVGG
jgi:four helix bundle protein